VRGNKIALLIAWHSGSREFENQLRMRI